MFVTLQSRNGGKKMNALFNWGRKSKIENLDIYPDPKPKIVEDFYCLQIGYLKDGTPAFIKPSDGKPLFELLKSEFKD